MLYETITLEAKSFRLSGGLTSKSAGCLAALARTPPSLIEHHTKRLLFDGRLCSDIVLHTLSLCRGVEKVGTYIHACPEQAAILATLPNLRELSCPLDHLHEIARFKSLCEGISHLELEWDEWMGSPTSKDPGRVDALVPLQHFRRLTYLCLRPPAYQRENWLAGRSEIAWLIQICPSIRLLVIAPDYGESKKKLRKKTRVVQTSKQVGVSIVVIAESYWWKNDWAENALTMWNFAEACVATSD